MHHTERLWSPANPSSTRIEKFRVHVNEKYHLKLRMFMDTDIGVSSGRLTSNAIFVGNYHELWEWSTTDIENFWASVWEYCGVKASSSYTEVCLFTFERVILTIWHIQPNWIAGV